MQKVRTCYSEARSFMTPEEAPPHALPAPYGAVVWSPVTGNWYDKNGNIIR